MTLKLYNSLTRQKEEFTPEDAQNVRMYVCGPTVYARPHLGNARSVVVYDVLFRLLRHLYGEESITYVRNITDVDDKINAAAIERGISIQELTKEVTAQFHADMDALNCLRPSIEPTATGHIGEIISMIEKLIANGNAYEAEGHVLFDVSSECKVTSGEKESVTHHLPLTTWTYGMLSGRKTEEQEAGARIAVESYKKNPGDFVLWKPAKESDDASSKFDSPWGVGRPGWHIECSAMSTKHLGATFDIHGGGADLMFPHHENEIAQSRCADPHSQFARVWVHNGFLTVNGEKMSKSLGNFTTVKDVLDKGTDGEIIKYALFLGVHYRKPLDWNDLLLENARKKILMYGVALDDSDVYPGQYDSTQDSWHEAYQKFISTGEFELTEFSKKTFGLFVNALQDDMNVSIAERELYNLYDVTSDETAPPAEYYSAKAALKKCFDLLGIDPLRVYREKISAETTEGVAEYISEKITARAEAKKAKNWAEADRIRDELKAQGVILEDRPDGTTDWRRA